MDWEVFLGWLWFKLECVCVCVCVFVFVSSGVLKQVRPWRLKPYGSTLGVHVLERRSGTTMDREVFLGFGFLVKSWRVCVCVPFLGFLKQL